MLHHLHQCVLSLTILVSLVCGSTGVHTASGSADADIPSKLPNTPLIQRQIAISIAPPLVSTSSSYDYSALYPGTGTSVSASLAVLTGITPPLASIGTTTTPPSPSGPSSTSFSTGQNSVFSTSSSPTQTAEAATARGSIKAIDFVPAIVALGVFLTGLSIWIIQGCCTRKPRVRNFDDDGVLVCGPPYVDATLRNDGRPDVEERGRDYGHDHQQAQDMLEVSKYGIGLGRVPGELGRTPQTQHQYRWPSFSEQPTFDPAKGFHVRDEYQHNESDPFLPAQLVVPEDLTRDGTNNTSRPRLPNWAPTGGTTKREHTSHPESITSPQFSDNTSIALQELYESDDDEEARRRGRETPWESLRHKSIRRGIIEQVKKENKWMDSIRGSLAAGSALFANGANKTDCEGESSGLLERMEDGDSGRKRRTHIRQDSDISIDSEEYVSRTPLKVRNPSSGRLGTMGDSTQSSPTLSHSGVRRGFTVLSSGDEDDKYTPIPSRIREDTSRSRNNSRSPVASRSSARSRSTHQSSDQTAPLRDVLPKHPAQITSPPLESHICFTPIPAQAAKVGPVASKSPKSVGPKTKPESKSGFGATRSVNSTQPLRPVEHVGRSSDPFSNTNTLPFPSSRNTDSPPPKAYRGRLVKKATASPAARKSGGRLRPSKSKSISNSGPSHPEPVWHGTPEKELAMKKVEQIMEHGWIARDMGQEAMRCLSPTGFGREV